MKIRFRRLAFAVVVPLLALSCAQDPTSAAQKILTQQCSTLSNGYLKLTKFTKHDAVPQKINGVDYYTVKYSVEAEGIQDGGYLYMCQSHGENGLVMGFEVSSAPSQGDCFVFPVQKGRTYRFDETGFPTRRYTHEMTLAKHESGWVVAEQ